MAITGTARKLCEPEQAFREEEMGRVSIVRNSICFVNHFFERLGYSKILAQYGGNTLAIF